MTENTTTIKTMKILHRAMYVGPLFFSAAVTYLVASKSALDTLGISQDIMQVVAIALAVLAIVIGEKIFKNKIIQLKEIEGHKIKLDLFRQASIIQWVLLEGAALFSLVGFFMSTNYAFLALALGLILYLIFLAPSAMKTNLLTGIPKEEL